jgi:hypothetical protein
MPLAPELEAILKERARVYGPPSENHRAIARIWGAILGAAGLTDGEPLRIDLVALLMVGLKLARAAPRTTLHKDTFDDIQVYTQIAYDLRKEAPINERLGREDAHTPPFHSRMVQGVVDHDEEGTPSSESDLDDSRVVPGWEYDHPIHSAPRRWLSAPPADPRISATTRPAREGHSPGCLMCGMSVRPGDALCTGCRSSLHQAFIGGA